jgi:hypothetical protein
MPIFDYVDERMKVVSSRPRPEARPGSALHGDNRRLRGYHITTAAVSALNSAVEHVYAVRALFVDAHISLPHVPLTLLRSALEDASLTVWLLQPDEPGERMTRALRTWYRDMGDRSKYEDTEGIVRRHSRWQSAKVRQEDILAVARERGLDPARVQQRLSATAVIRAAAAVIDDGSQAGRLWQLSSGQAHGRIWAILKNQAAYASATSRGTYNVSLVANKQNVIALAQLDHSLIVKGEELLQLRSELDRKR